ncbi:MmcQ/YjbR family DNA-binding protein [Devosia sp.]|uniref:MmcQ/YjbR family DNA-binding protein n=1 Tax=Devosia sp. TaxID=1871048 RepID=UPI003262D690
MALADTVEAPHFDRAAFRVKRIYTTLAADGLTANLKLLPDEQEFKCLVAADAFAPVPNAWGKQGWTTLTLANVDEAELHAALEMAWRHALPAEKKRR